MTTSYSPPFFQGTTSVDDELDPKHFPADYDLEQAILGAILVEPPLVGELDFIQPEDFYDSKHREIFKRMCALWDAGDMLGPELIADRDPQLLSACLAAQAYFVSPLQAQSYAHQLKELSKKRSFIPMLNRAAEMSFNGTSSDAVHEFLLESLSDFESHHAKDGWVLESASCLDELPKPREWFLNGLIARGQVSMMYGPPGIKKTMLLMDMCAAMAAGQSWLPRYANQEDHESLVTFQCERPARILWIDYDNGIDETRIRMRAVMQARNWAGKDNFLYMSEASPWLELDNPTHVRKLIKLIQANRIDVVVIDALGMVLGGVDENSPEVGKVIAKLKEIRSATGAALIVVHHPSKAGARSQEASGYNASGHAKFLNFFEWAVELRAGERPGIIVAEVVKHRGWAKTSKFAASFSYKHFGSKHPELAHELESFKFYPEALKDAASKKGKATRDAIVAALQGAGEINQKHLVEAATREYKSVTDSSIGDKTLRSEIELMVEEGLLNKRPTGEHRPVFYSLATPVGSVG